jgi:Na+-driven multidrug efflux pump
VIIVGLVGIVVGVATMVFAHPLARFFNEVGPFTFADRIRMRVAGAGLIAFGMLFVVVGSIVDLS